MIVRGNVNQGARFQDMTGLTVEVATVDDSGRVHWTAIGNDGVNEHVISGTMSLESFMKRFAVKIGKNPRHAA